MKDPDKKPPTRREALLVSIKATLGTSLALPAIAGASNIPARAPEFVPENDYPFFGGELPEGY